MHVPKDFGYKCMKKKLLFFLFFFAQVRTFHWQVEFFIFFYFYTPNRQPVIFLCAQNDRSVDSLLFSLRKQLSILRSLWILTDGNLEMGIFMGHKQKVERERGLMKRILCNKTSELVFMTRRDRSFWFLSVN